MRILITGAAGFLGAECVRQFRAAGHDVVRTDRAGDVDLPGDLSDRAFVASLPDIDVLVNCAAVQYVTKGVPLIARKPFFVRNNIEPAKNLAERYGQSGTHVIHVGTSMMYRQTGQSLYTIGDEMSGEGVYSWSKTQAQRYIDQIPGAATVIPCIIGGEGREGLFRGFVSMMQKRGMVVFPGQGTHKIHMVHVVDVASLILQLAKTRASGFYNAAAPDPLSISEWIDEIADELHISKVRKISLPLLPVQLISSAVGYRLLAREQLLMLRLPHVLSIDKSLATGWTPKFTNARIARDIARYIAGS